MWFDQSEQQYNLNVTQNIQDLKYIVRNITIDDTPFTRNELTSFVGYANNHYRHSKKMNNFGIVVIDGQTDSTDLPDLDFFVFVTLDGFVALWHDQTLVNFQKNVSDSALQPILSVLHSKGFTTNDTVEIEVKTAESDHKLTLAAYIVAVISNLYYSHRDDTAVVLEKLENFMPINGFVPIQGTIIPVVAAMARALRLPPQPVDSPETVLQSFGSPHAKFNGDCRFFI